MDKELLEFFSDLKGKNMITVKDAKENGAKVVGIYCTYGPRELVLAAGAIPVGICGTHEETITYAEKDLPRNLCPVIKSSYGFAVSDQCPYFHFSDLILGETTCDGKKKMFELMNKIKPVHVMDIPQNPNLEDSLKQMYLEMKVLKDVLEKNFDVEITNEKLREAIHIVNENNKALKRLHDLNKSALPMIFGSDLLNITFQLGFHTDRYERVRMLDKLVEKIKEKSEAVDDGNKPRILVTGTPIGTGCEKIITLVEECGGIVIAMENCFGYKTLGLQINEDDDRDPLLLLAEKYINVGCAIMSPNNNRTELLKEMVSDFNADGVIDLSWQACHGYNIESYFIEREVKNKFGLPYLHIETDFSSSDNENLRARIEAFMEMI